MDENKINQLSHFDQDGNANMVDVGDKQATKRRAVAAGSVFLSEKAYKMVQAGHMAKGDVLGVARIAGIMAAKKVDSLIPLTHSLPLDFVEIHFDFINALNRIDLSATAGITGKTGVEMEALTAVSICALTIYDMCKAVDKSIKIDNIRLLEKSGGKSGFFRRDKE